jgi:hypothetical protein
MKARALVVILEDWTERGYAPYEALFGTPNVSQSLIKTL